jgi:ketosteroid isomerase-like protein
MKQRLAVFLVLLFCMSPVQAQKSASQPTSQAGLDAASAELVRFTNAWTDAINANDRAKLEAFLAPDFAACGWNGELWANRSKWLDNVHLFTENALHEISPRVYGDFAIVTSVTTFVVTYDGWPPLQQNFYSGGHLAQDEWKVAGRHPDHLSHEFYLTFDCQPPWLICLRSVPV